MIRFVFILLSVILLIPGFSCNSDDTREPVTFYGLLEMFPAETPISEGDITLINYRKIWEDDGISFYKEDGSKMNQEEIFEALKTIITRRSVGEMAFGHGSCYSGLDVTLLLSPIQYDTLGYDLIVDVDAEITHGGVLDNTLRVGMKGNFSLQATKEALQNQEEWPEWVAESFKTERYLGVPVYSWGENPEKFADGNSPPHLDLHGIARPLAAMDGNMLIGGTVDIVKDMISTVKGKTPSLADVPEYALIAEHMDSLGVYRVLIRKTTTEDDVFNLLMPSQDVLTVGFGYGREEQVRVIEIIAVYENENLAEESEGIQKESLVERLMKFGTETDYIDIRRDGRILYIKFNTPGFH